MQGLDWCRDQPVSVGINSITKKCLCQHHNSELASADTEVINYFQVLDDIAELTSAANIRPDKEVRARLSGWNIERWMLKTLITNTVGSEYLLGPFGEEPGVPHHYLVDVAFGTTKFEFQMGMYALATDGQKIVANRGVHLMPIIKENMIGGAVFTLGGIAYFLSLIPDRPPARFGDLGISGELAEARFYYRQTTLEWTLKGRVRHSMAIAFDGA